jgi:lipopolysaccharide/colanic/teichoic acid biosynthesis glycosyltransferase
VSPYTAVRRRPSTEPAPAYPRLTDDVPGLADEPDAEYAPPPRFRMRVRIDAARFLNVSAALLLLVLAAPVMLVVALLVKLTSPGPVIFRQTRVGVDRRTPGSSPAHWRRAHDYGGRLFTMYKIRTMTAAPAASALQVWAQPDDPRVTRVGRVLRRYRLDELPQLFNVLRGDMNLVGPRPEQPRIFAELREQVEDYAARQRVLPGITGWAQVTQAYDTCLDDVRGKVRRDLEYIAGRSVRLDLAILLRTVPVVMLRRGGW